MNWFGSMFFIGLCSPLIVWLVVYYIRTRSKNLRNTGDDKSDKTDKKEKTLKKARSLSRSTLKAQIRREIKPLDGWIAPTSDIRQPNPRNRMSKREHFCRYLGWWTTSVAEPRKSDEHKAEEDRARDPPVPPPTEPRPWRVGGHPVAHISLENLAERGQLLRALSSIPEVVTPKTEVPPTSTGVEARQVDGPHGSNAPRAKDFYIMSGGLGSDELGSDDNNTVRKRTIGKVQASRWAELSHQLSKSAHHRLLIFDNSQQATPDSETGEQRLDKRQQQIAETDFHGHEDETTLAPTPDLNPLNESPLILGSLTGPKLRKVFSSPTLHTAFSRDAVDGEKAKASNMLETYPSDFPHQSSAPIILYPYRDNLDISTWAFALKDHTNLPETAVPGQVKGISSHTKVSSPLVATRSANDPNSTRSSKTYRVPAPPTGDDLLPPKCRKRRHSPPPSQQQQQQQPGRQRQPPRNLHSWSWDRTRRSTIDVADPDDDDHDGSHDERRGGMTGGNHHHHRSPYTTGVAAEEELPDGMERYVGREYEDGLDVYERCDSLLDEAVEAVSSCSSTPRRECDDKGHKRMEGAGVVQNTGEAAERSKDRGGSRPGG